MKRSSAAALAAVFLLAACYSGDEKPGPNDGSTFSFDVKATITVDDSGIHPDVTTARVGDTLTVTNRGTRDHGLTSETIETGTLHPGESTTVYLSDAKTIEMHDRADPTHTGRIEVAGQ